MVTTQQLLPALPRPDAQIVAILVDGTWYHVAFAKDRMLHFPLLAGVEPKDAVARVCNAYRSADGVCERAPFVIEDDGKVAWSDMSPIGVNPGADGILRALEELDQRRSD